MLIRAQGAAENRGEALRAWEQVRALLAEELGADPAPETEAVYLQVLREPTVLALPTGVVSFLLTDIVDSSALWERDRDAMSAALQRHDALIGETVAAHGGVLLKSKLEGDATVSVFPRATDAVAAAVGVREALQAESWPEGAAPSVRIAVHAGEAIERDGDYLGPALNRAARLSGLAGGGHMSLPCIPVFVVANRTKGRLARTWH